MSVFSRTVYGRAFQVTPVWMWVTQRLSGLVLGPLVALHMLSHAVSSNRAMNFALLAVVLAHGYSGLRRLVNKERSAGMHVGFAAFWCAVVAIFGAMIVVL